MKKNLIIIFTTLILFPNISIACHEGGFQADYHKGAFNKSEFIYSSIKLRCGNNNPYNNNPYNNNPYNNSFSNICY